MSQICKKASRKLHALSRVSKYMDINKQIMLMNPFIISQFPHCLCCGCFTAETLKTEPLIYIKELWRQFIMTTLTSFDKLFLKHKSVSIHQRNLQFQLVGIFKVNNCVSTRVTEDIFQCVDKPYDLRKNSILLEKKKGQLFTKQKGFIIWLQKSGN